MLGTARHTPTLTGSKAARLVVADIALLPDIGDAITQLSIAQNWTEISDPIEDILAAVFETVTEYYNVMLIGLVSQFLASIPLGWLQLDGSTHLKVDYPLLWERLPSQLRTASDFTLPDLTGVFINGATDASEIGNQGGSNSYALTIAQLAAHTHTEIPAVLGVDVGGAGPPLPSATPGTPIATSSTGSGDDIDNRPAYVEMLFAVYAGQE